MTRKMIMRLPLMQLKMMEIMKQLTTRKKINEEESEKETDNKNPIMKANDREMEENEVNV